MRTQTVQKQVVGRWAGWLIAFSCFLFMPAFAQAATLSLSPDTGVYTAGELITVRVVLNTAGANINAADGRIQVSGSGVSIASVSQAGSIFSLWAEAPQVQGNQIIFSGGIPTGYSGSGGSVFSFTLRTSSAGTVRVNFQDGSVLAADGRGSNVLSSMNGASYTVRAQERTPEPETVQYVPAVNTPAAPVITSATHSDSAGWSSQTTAELAWTVPSGVTQVRTAVSQSATTIPNNVADGLVRSYTATDLPDGVSYLHVQFRNADGWGQIGRYRLAVDTQPPRGMEVVRDEAVPLYEPEQRLLISVATSTAPIVRAVVQISGGDALEYELSGATSTITLPPLDPGYHVFTVEVFNAAGQSVVQSLSLTIESFTAPEIDSLPAQLTAGTIPVFAGTTRPGAEVVGFLRNVANDTRDEYRAVSGDDGRFQVIPDRPLRSGIYEFTARAIDASGARSEVSAPIRFIVQEPGYVQFGAFMISVLSIVVPALALIILLIMSLWYGFYRWRRLRRRVATESLEAHEMVQTEFAALEDVLKEEELALAASRKNGQLTKAEAALLERVREQVRQAQKRVEKEVADVESLVPPSSRTRASVRNKMSQDT